MFKFVVLCAVLFCATIVASQLVGGYVDRSIEDDDVAFAAKFAAQALGLQFKTPYHAKLTKVRKAQSQVVAGVNYKFNLIVGLTNCKKAEVDYEKIEECEYQDSVSTYRKCEVVIFRDLKGNHRLSRHACILAGRNEI